MRASGDLPAVARLSRAHRAIRGSSAICIRSVTRKTSETRTASTSVSPWITGIVAAVDAIDHQPADAGHGEDGLGDDGAAEQRPEMQAEQRDRRDERVAQHVAAEARCDWRRPLARAKSTYSAFSTSMIGGAQIAHQHGREAERQRQRRQEEMIEVLGQGLAIAADRKPAQPGGEDGQQHEADIEDRRGQPDLEQAADEKVGPAVAVERRDEGERHGQQQAPTAPAMAVSNRVTGRRSMIRRVTGTWKAIESPRSPRKTLPRKCRTASESGWSSPIGWLMRVIASSVAWSPSSALIGSPGRRCTSTKTITLMDKRSGRSGPAGRRI